jgi:microcin C transport system permease protein
MWHYIFKRFLFIIPTLIGVITITFVISEYVPGGPLDQIQAMLEGNLGPGGAGGGEVSITGQNAHDGKNKKIDPKLEMRLKRIYGLNHNPIVRYLRTILWFGRDSIISSNEIDNDSTEKFVCQDKNAIILRLDNKYYAFFNKWTVDDKKGEVVFDKLLGKWRSVLDGATFDCHTGKLLGDKHNGINNRNIKSGNYAQNAQKDIPNKNALVYSGGAIAGLTPIPLSVYNENNRQEVYIRESFWGSLVNYANWHGFFILKFGKSITKNKTVLELILERLPVSISLGVFSFFITYTVCVILGIAKAVKHGTPFDSFTSMIILVGYSIPGFVLAVLLIVLFGPGESHIIDLIPISGLTSYGLPGYDSWSVWHKILDYLHHIVAPIICLSIGSFAVLTMLTKNSVLEEVHKLYAVAARARGLSERKVLFRHIFRNSLIPLVTGFPASFLAMFFTGSLLIEQIFSLNGLGLLSYTSVIERDFPVIMGSLFVFTTLGLVANLLRDVCYVIVDPRISFEKGQS